MFESTLDTRTSAESDGWPQFMPLIIAAWYWASLVDQSKEPAKLIANCM